MFDLSRSDNKVLALIVCAALSARYIQEFILLAQAEEWDVWVIATPSSRDFIDEPSLTELTGHPIMIDHDHGTKLHLSFRAAIVLPATFNTLKKWAASSMDNVALSLLIGLSDLSIPLLVFPRASRELAQDPAFAASLSVLRKRNICVFYEPELYPPNNNVLWSSVLLRLNSALNA